MRFLVVDHVHQGGQVLVSLVNDVAERRRYLLVSLRDSDGHPTEVGLEGQWLDFTDRNVGLALEGGVLRLHLLGGHGHKSLVDALADVISRGREVQSDRLLKLCR